MKKATRIPVLLLAALLLAGCGSSRSSYAAESASSAEVYAMDSFDGGAGGAESSLVPNNAAEAATDETAQKIIYNADMRMESTDFNAARDTLLAAVDANNAWLEYSSVSGTEKDRDRYASYTVRVPVQNYRAFLSAAGEAGSVQNLSENAQNITSNYIDVQARLTALETQRDRLNALADRAESTADLLEIESQLSDVQYQIENYTSQLKNMDQQVRYSTVDISLQEVAVLTPTGTAFGERVVEAFGGGWNAFTVFVQGFVLALVYLWPVLLLVVAVFFVIRAILRRRAKKPKQQKPLPPAAEYPAKAKEEPKPKY